MPFDLQITGLTQEQMIEIRDAFLATQGPIPVDEETGLPRFTPAQFTKWCILRFIKSVVKGHKRAVHESSVAAESAAVEDGYGDAVA